MAQLVPPDVCDAPQLQEFEHLVRAGFDGSDAGLPARIRTARWLAFHHTSRATLAAIAALKGPAAAYRDDVFAKAAPEADPTGYELELGWVFVVPEQRRQGIAAALCRALLAREPGHPVFATTRPDNTAMIGILSALDFERLGRPYPHVRRDEELALFVRGSP
ncbi:MAG: GNAT family N-acetyltransferase [Acidobacteriota bacterium]|jgi:GNAT superfamily N-acetyltransferase